MQNAGPSTRIVWFFFGCPRPVLPSGPPRLSPKPPSVWGCDARCRKLSPKSDLPPPPTGLVFSPRNFFFFHCQKKKCYGVFVSLRVFFCVVFGLLYLHFPLFSVSPNSFFAQDLICISHLCGKLTPKAPSVLGHTPVFLYGGPNIPPLSF